MMFAVAALDAQTRLVLFLSTTIVNAFAPVAYETHRSMVSNVHFRT